MTEKLRWQYRFDNFHKCYILLQEAMERIETEEVEQLAKEGAIQRFKFCMELAWKVIKDYLEHQGVVFRHILPRVVIKEAMAGKLISNGEIWMEALDARNKMSHTYNEKTFEQVLEQISASYLPCFSELYEVLMLEYKNEDESLIQT